MTTTHQSSSGVPMIDYLYLNQLFEKEFAHDKIKVEWHFFKGAGPAINEALANKQLDLAFLGDLPMIIAKANGLDTTLLMATNRKIRGYLAVRPNQGYSDFASLKGKRIAIWQGTANQLSFNSILKQQGYSEKDFRLINLDPIASSAALVAGQIDAIWGGANLLALQQKGTADIPLSSLDVDDTAGTFQTGIVAHTDFVKQHPQVVQRFINTALKSAYWVSQPDHQDQAIDMVVQQAGFSRDLLKLGFKGQEFVDINSPLLDQFYLNHLQESVNFAYEARLIKHRFNVKQWADPHFINTAIQQLGYTQVWKQD
ncbi:ABC transporter substrate-binding protein [Acinetobacter puyangensis]|uniref:ABC transporter substrate-binding protein n=1 Tax=Acinetobacter puyangensis TaxID=1096779 RepID=UPI003A4D71D3